MKTLNVPVRIALATLFFYLIAAGNIKTSVQKMHGDLENTNCYDSKDHKE